MVSISPSRPTGLLKLGFTLPRYLYRWHLGWLLGHRCLMMTHIGRKSGRRRQTVLEVVRYDPSTQECIVMSGYGAQSDWYRNIQLRPVVEVQIGRQHYTPRQRMLAAEETYAILSEYRQQHPWLFREFMQMLGYSYDGTDESLHTLSHALRGVALRPERL